MPASVFDFGAIRARLYQLGERATFLWPIPHRILVVDDDQVIVEVLTAYLVEREGHVVSGALNGCSALATVEAESPDLILLDTLMPGMHGCEICRRVKADQATADIPVIMMSADLNDERLSFEAGADDFLFKPFPLAALAARIRAQLRRKRD
jgi:DNA-binding response OmpR family regulator